MHVAFTIKRGRLNVVAQNWVQASCVVWVKWFLKTWPAAALYMLYTICVDKDKPCIYLYIVSQPTLPHMCCPLNLLLVSSQKERKERKRQKLGLMFALIALTDMVIYMVSNLIKAPHGIIISLEISFRFWLTRRRISRVFAMDLF